MTHIESMRREAGLTALAYLARATIDTSSEYPALNATPQRRELTTHDGVHLGIAVSLGQDGRIVPVIRNGQHLSVEGLAKPTRDLARRARARAL